MKKGRINITFTTKLRSSSIILLVKIVSEGYDIECAWDMKNNFQRADTLYATVLWQPVDSAACWN